MEKSLSGGRYNAINSKTLQLSHGGEVLLNKEGFGSIRVHCVFTYFKDVFVRGD